MKDNSVGAKVKEAGFNGVEELQDILGFKSDNEHVVSYQTLKNWLNNKEELFHAVLIGAKQIQKLKEEGVKPSIYIELLKELKALELDQEQEKLNLIRSFKKD